MSNRLFSNDKFSNDAPKLFKVGVVAMVILWLLGILLSLGVTGVLIWAIIKLVTKLCA